MKKIILYTAITIFIYAAFFSGCDNSLINSGENVIFPDSNVSYLYHVQPYLKYACGTYYCHNSISRKYDFDVEDYFSIMRVPGLIRIGYPDDSRLVQILENPSNHTPILDVIYWRINQNQKKGIRLWIKEGALNN